MLQVDLTTSGPIFRGQSLHESVVQYDPKIGFSVRSDQSIYTSIVWCIARLGNQEAEQYFMVMYEGKLIIGRV